MIESFLENDLYKFTMGQVAYSLFPGTEVEYKLIVRDDIVFPEGFAYQLRYAISKFEDIKLTGKESAFLLRKCPFLSQFYSDFLMNYRYNLSQVKIEQNEGQLSVKVKGLWKDTIFWEVPLLATISELYNSIVYDLKPPKNR